jgi:hypothetical protein
MVNPTRDTTAGRVYKDLRNSVRRQKRATDEVMVEYVLERFLYRLATSPAGREHFVLKGGLLLAQFGARRTTRDIDILGQAFTGEDTEIVRRVRAIATTDVDDGGAVALAIGIRDTARRAASGRPIHLFQAAPLGLALLLGHRWNRVAPTYVYEDLNPGYVHAFTVRA